MTSLALGPPQESSLLAQAKKLDSQSTLVNKLASSEEFKALLSKVSRGFRVDDKVFSLAQTQPPSLLNDV